MLLLLVLVELLLLLLLLGEDVDGRLWLRKTPGAMGCGPPGDFTAPLLNSWSVRLPSWESRLCSDELLSWEIFSGSSFTIAFFLVLFFFFLVFCCSSYGHIFLHSAIHKGKVTVITWKHYRDTTWCESFAAAAASPVSMEATRAPSLAGRSWRGTEGPTRAVTMAMYRITTYWPNKTMRLTFISVLSIYLLGCMECHRCFSVFLIEIWRQDYPLQIPTRGKLKPKAVSDYWHFMHVRISVRFKIYRQIPPYLKYTMWLKCTAFPCV